MLFFCLSLTRFRSRPKYHQHREPVQPLGHTGLSSMLAAYTTLEGSRATKTGVSAWGRGKSDFSPNAKS
jgi:hypothetical protein